MRGGANFLQILLTLSNPYTKSMYFNINLVADNTTAQLEWAKLGIILCIVSSISLNLLGTFSAKKSKI